MKKANIVIFALLMGTFSILTFLPPDAKAAEAETLEPMPKFTWASIRDNTFPRDFEEYLSDNVAFRSYFLSAARAIESGYGLKANEGLIEVGNTYLLWSDRIMEIFRQKPETQARYAAVINEIAGAVGGNVRVFNIIGPTQAEFLAPEYKNLSESQKEAIDQIYGLLDESVTPVDAYGALEAHKDEYIFFRTDHHWTQLGAYYTYRAYCEAAGFEPIALSDYDERVAEGFLGYLYNTHPSSNLAANADDIHYYVYNDEDFITSKPLFQEGVVSYALFLQGDVGYYDIATSVKNGRTAIIVKDSYANCLIPFLAPHYENVIVIDPRHTEEGFSVAAETAKYDPVDLIYVNYVLSTTFDDTVTITGNVK
ncbi:MAG: hypothetical protein LBS19_14250 [Clostridiales bacterium]|jgi:hypothetical protein|nr:hypothetical protein [Clostridiales bacterium]